MTPAGPNGRQEKNCLSRSERVTLEEKDCQTRLVRPECNIRYQYWIFQASKTTLTYHEYHSQELGWVHPPIPQSERRV